MQREQKPADRRADDHGGLEDDRPQGQRAHEDLARHERRCHGPGGGCAEGRGDTCPEREQEERPRLVGTCAGDGEQPEHHRDIDTGCDREQRPPWEPIRQVPGRQGEEWQRNEHREPDEAEIERIASNGIDLPADRDERHLDGEPRRQHDAEEEDEIAVPERRVARRRGRVAAVYAASPSSASSAGSGTGRNSTSSRWIRDPSTSRTVNRRPSDRTSSPGSAARPIRSKT